METRLDQQENISDNNTSPHLCRPVQNQIKEYIVKEYESPDENEINRQVTQFGLLLDFLAQASLHELTFISLGSAPPSSGKKGLQQLQQLPDFILEYAKNGLKTQIILIDPLFFTENKYGFQSAPVNIKNQFIETSSDDASFQHKEWPLKVNVFGCGIPGIVPGEVANYFYEQLKLYFTNTLGKNGYIFIGYHISTMSPDNEIPQFMQTYSALKAGYPKNIELYQQCGLSGLILFNKDEKYTLSKAKNIGIEAFIDTLSGKAPTKIVDINTDIREASECAKEIGKLTERKKQCRPSLDN